MNIRLGIYEIFSRIIPGGVYLAAVGQSLYVLGLLKFDWLALNEISFIASVALVVVAYIIGGAFDRAALVWFRVFKKPGLSARTFADFKKKHQARWKFELGDDDWSILLAFIRTRNLELAGELDRHNAISLMLRNVSLGLLLMAVNTLVQGLLTGQSAGLVASLFLFVISILTVLESVKFRSWFYNGIFETVLAYRIDLEGIVRPARAVSERVSKRS